jgi:hypothetical protein
LIAFSSHILKHSFLAEALRRTYYYVVDLYTDISVYLKVKARELCCYPTPGTQPMHYASLCEVLLVH